MARGWRAHGVPRSSDLGQAVHNTAVTQHLTWEVPMIRFPCDGLPRSPGCSPQTNAWSHPDTDRARRCPSMRGRLRSPGLVAPLLLAGLPSCAPVRAVEITPIVGAYIPGAPIANLASVTPYFTSVIAHQRAGLMGGGQLCPSGSDRRSRSTSVWGIRRAASSRSPVTVHVSTPRPGSNLAATPRPARPTTRLSSWPGAHGPS